MLCCRDPIRIVVGFPRCFQRSVRVFENLLDASAWTKFRVEVPKISALPDSFATMMNVERKGRAQAPSPAYAKGKVPGGVPWQKTGTNSRKSRARRCLCDGSEGFEFFIVLGVWDLLGRSSF